MSRHKTRHRLLSLFSWHRYMGLVLALFALLFAVTGLILNHTEELALDDRYVRSKSLLRLYGITAPAIETTFFTGSHWASQLGERLYLDDRELPVTTEYTLIGAAQTSRFLALCTAEEIVLLSMHGELIDMLGPEAHVPAPIVRFGITQNHELVVQTPQDTYISDDEVMKWRDEDIDVPLVTWSKRAYMPSDLREKIEQLYLRKGLPFERVVLDLHSGRIFGLAGTLVFDAAGIILILLALTGLGLWYIRLRKRQLHRKTLAQRH